MDFLALSLSKTRRKLRSFGFEESKQMLEDSVGSLGINGNDGGILLVVDYYLFAVPQKLVCLDD